MFTTLIIAVQLLAPPVSWAQDFDPSQILSAQNQEQAEVTITASWDNSVGKRMANGQVFDATKNTAAHKSLPFGTRVRLTNPETNKSLVVEISDRGPFVKGRDFDVSKGAAERLGFKEKGVTRLLAKVILPQAS
ncbi:MAG: septal ring lytic transglycosylase RlpA family protein [Candidatus Buchananbacteria bacterium]